MSEHLGHADLSQMAHIQGVPFKTSNIFRIDRTRLGNQGFPHSFFLFRPCFRNNCKKTLNFGQFVFVNNF